MYSDLYHSVARSCCYISVFLGDERISTGTGYACDSNGGVLTAAHVVTGRWPIRHDDYKNAGQTIYCRFPRVPLLEYQVAFCSIEIYSPGFVGAVQLDLAYLLPKERLRSPIPHIPSRVYPPRLGEEVFMAGYSEEVELPNRVDRLLVKGFPGVENFREAMEKGYMADIAGPLFKRGVVGNIQRITAMGSEVDERVDSHVMYIDNAMNPGASGGPLFNSKGEAVGVLSQRAVTGVDAREAGVINVPSGCTVAISLAPLVFVEKRKRVEGS